MIYYIVSSSTSLIWEKHQSPLNLRYRAVHQAHNLPDCFHYGGGRIAFISGAIQFTKRPQRIGQSGPGRCQRRRRTQVMFGNIYCGWLNRFLCLGYSSCLLPFGGNRAWLNVGRNSISLRGH